MWKYETQHLPCFHRVSRTVMIVHHINAVSSTPCVENIYDTHPTRYPSNADASLPTPFVRCPMQSTFYSTAHNTVGFCRLSSLWVQEDKKVAMLAAGPPLYAALLFYP
jgi:hypothetical protein